MLIKRMRNTFFLFILIFHSSMLYSQSKDMIKLNWYHYIILSPVIIIDGIKRSYTAVSKSLENSIETFSLPELHRAVMESNKEKVQQLVSSGVPLEAKDKNGETALFYALDRNLWNIAAFLIQKNANVNATNNNGRHVVQQTIMKNQYDLLKMMVDHGLNLQISKKGDTVLTFACSQNQPNFKMIQLFVNSGVNINAKDKFNYTALMYLTTKEKPNFEIIRYLIEKGADTNAKDSSGRSIIRLLIENRNLDQKLLDLLISNGADINSRDKEGKSIFDYMNLYFEPKETERFTHYLKKKKIH